VIFVGEELTEFGFVREECEKFCSGQATQAFQLFFYRSLLSSFRSVG